MDKTIFESFEDYLEDAEYPQGKKKIMRSAVDLISSKGYNGTSTLNIAKHAGLSQLPYLSILKRKTIC